MSRWEAPGKLNLALIVHAPRGDGYHPIDSMVQTVEWCDLLEFEAVDEAEDVVEVDHPDVHPEGELVARALAAVRARGDFPRQRVRVDKRLPVGAGLGGGSSDAAATVMAAGPKAGLQRPEMVEVAAQALAHSRRVDIYGVGYSSFTALDAKLKFVRLGLIADAYGDAHLQVMAAASLSAQDVAIGISNSGSTKDVVDALLTARKSGATTVAITNFSPSPITRASDVVLLTASPESPLGGEVLTSRIAQLCVLDVLSTAIAVTLGEGCLDLIKKTSEAVKKKRY